MAVRLALGGHDHDRDNNETGASDSNGGQNGGESGTLLIAHWPTRVITLFGSPGIFGLPITAGLAFVVIALFGQTRPSDIDIARELRTISDQHSSMIREVAALTQHVADLEKRIDIHRSELDALDPARYTDRLTRVEDFVARHERESQQQSEVSRVHWDSLMGWLRGVSLGLIGFAVNEIWKRYQEKRRHALLAAAVEVQRQTVVRLEENTNHKMDELLRLKGESEKEKGRVEGRAEKS